jgi:hypothetical protein
MKQQSGSTIKPAMSLLDANGRELAAASDCKGSASEQTIQSFRLPAAGWYTIRARGCDDTTGAFQVTLSKAN